MEQGKQRSRRNTLCISRLCCAALGQKTRCQHLFYCKSRSSSHKKIDACRAIVKRNQASSIKQMHEMAVRDFSVGQTVRPQEYFVYFKGALCGHTEKNLLISRADVWRRCPNKKGSRAKDRSPCYHSRFASSEAHACGLHLPYLGGQNLAALCTATGENLAAIGSSHSLAETVNLGTVASAGLIGTLHYDTPPVKITYAQQPDGRSNA